MAKLSKLRRRVAELEAGADGLADEVVRLEGVNADLVAENVRLAGELKAAEGKSRPAKAAGR